MCLTAWLEAQFYAEDEGLKPLPKSFILLLSSGMLEDLADVRVHPPIAVFEVAENSSYDTIIAFC